MSTFLEDLAGYNSTKFKHDVTAGLAVATLAVPQAMAYATIAEIPVVYGLYSAIAVTIVASIFSSYGLLINGPTNAICVMIADVNLMHLMDEHAIAPGDFMSVVFLLTLMVGVIQLVGAFARFGGLANFISPSVIVGFTLGAATLIVIRQVPKLLGLELPGEGDEIALFGLELPDQMVSVKILLFSAANVAEAHGATLAVGVVCAAFMMAYRPLRKRWMERSEADGTDKTIASRVLRYAPPPLIAIGGAAAVAFAFDLGSAGVQLVDLKPEKLPPLSRPLFDLKLMWALFPSALAIAMVGIIEAIGIARSIAASRGDRFDANRQVWGEAAGNIAGAFFSSFACASSFTRSAVNVEVGGETRFSGIFCGLFVALFAVLLSDAISFIPMVALSGVLVAVAIRLVDPAKLMRSLRSSRVEAVIVVATAAWAVLFSLEGAILLGVALSILFYMPRAAELSVRRLIRDEKGIIREKGEQEPPCSRLAILDLEGALFFGAIPSLVAALDRLAAEATDFKILRLHNTHHLDAVTCEELGRFVVAQHERGNTVMMCGIRPHHIELLERMGVMELLGPDNVFIEERLARTSTVKAVGAAYLRIGPHRCPLCSGGERHQMDPPFTYMI